MEWNIFHWTIYSLWILCGISSIIISIKQIKSLTGYRKAILNLNLSATKMTEMYLREANRAEYYKMEVAKELDKLRKRVSNLENEKHIATYIGRPAQLFDGSDHVDTEFEQGLDAHNIDEALPL